MFGLRRLPFAQHTGKSSEPATQMRTFYHYQFADWKDKRVPTHSETSNVLQFIEDVNDQWRSTNYALPIIVHCRLLPPRFDAANTQDVARSNECIELARLLRDRR